ncbi:MAG TPA: TetR/AcrR family transcriptional regulator [Candidatus Krumholzibacteria bacterium]|nr:TetR/AcrR family transcriptional regulator [Candidatus Krumholzibacteria bacterium]
METKNRTKFPRRKAAGDEGRPAPEAAGSAERDDARRLAFFQAAEPVFERYGYRKTTVEDVCHAAGASKRTFYGLFADKADLASRMILHISQDIVSRWEGAVTPDMSARKKLERFIDEYVRLGREHRVFGQMMNDPDWMRAFGQLKDDRQFRVLMEVVYAVLTEGMKTREFRRLDPEAVTLIIYSLLDTMYYFVPATGAFASPFEDEKLAREIRVFLTQALIAPERE